MRLKIIQQSLPFQLSAFTMTSSDEDLKTITTELNHLSLKRQQLLERKKILSIFQELRRRAEFGQTGDRWDKLVTVHGREVKAFEYSTLPIIYIYIFVFLCQRKQLQIRLRSTALITNWSYWLTKKLNCRKAATASSVAREEKVNSSIYCSHLSLARSHFEPVTTILVCFFLSNSLLEVQSTSSEKSGPDDAAFEKNIFYVVAPPLDPGESEKHRFSF